MMYDIAICEDNPSDAALIQNMLDDYEESCSDVLRVRYCRDAESLIECILRGDYRPYAILVDIGLPGMSGINAVKEIRGDNVPCEVVFITSSPKYALEAWKINARQYFVKPPDREKFFAVMKSIIPQREYIIIKQKKEMRRIYLSDILYCETHGKYQAVITHTEEFAVRITAHRMHKLISAPTRVILLN